MDRQSKVNDFVFSLENLSSNVIPKSFEISEKHLSTLKDNILKYINENYPSIILSKEELKIEKVYQEKHYNLKKNIDSNIGMLKYQLEEENVDIDRIVEEEINKYKTLFTSISSGTNISYLGLVDKCTQNVMSLLIRKNTSISFAKRTEEVNNYIYGLINDIYFIIMKELGLYFIDKELVPIEENFKLTDAGKSKIKTEEFI